jgi:transcriptional regulator with PAS, ATPase and Fis domain
MGVVAVIQDLKSVGKFIYTLTGHEDYGLDNILGNSDSINLLKQQVQRVARSNSTVLIRGESGTGKELFARAIHAESQRNQGPFVGINCAAIPETLLESELFGYEEGSFTGAKKGGKLGKFELAQQGTLFLDEIGDMPLHLQVKLLRVLEERSFERIGGISPVKLEARLITATNRDLESMVKRGEFREDLYYRLNVIPFFIPPLRNRAEDINVLLSHFLNYYNKILQKSIKGFSREAESILLKYPWPGNVRELQNTVEYCAHMADTPYVEVHHLPQRMRQKVSPGSLRPPHIKPIELAEKELIANALKFYGSSLEGKKKAAAALGIGLTTLYRKGKKYYLPQFSE